MRTRRRSLFTFGRIVHAFSRLSNLSITKGDIVHGCSQSADLRVQDEEEEAEPEKPVKKAAKEEGLFAGNKNLRSEDQKYREIHDDRRAPPLPALVLPLAPLGTAGLVWSLHLHTCCMLEMHLPDTVLRALLPHAWDASSRILL